MQTNGSHVLEIIHIIIISLQHFHSPWHSYILGRPERLFPTVLCFTAVFFWHFAALYLRAASADRRETLTRAIKQCLLT